ncbi:MAG: hypothetical protein ABJC19_01255 [Gemmatimonadota bacterium]
MSSRCHTRVTHSPAQCHPVDGSSRDSSFPGPEAVIYRTCLYCSHDLEANPLIATQPVGRRLAFDAAVGRLWVVCPACAKWNLVPFDTRLEAIDACEQLFRDTRTRYSTENIGFARLPEGLDLIRIGSALKPEFAAWRYGTLLGGRRRRRSSLPLLDLFRGMRRAFRQDHVLRDPWTDRLVHVPLAALLHATLAADDQGSWKLEVPYRTGLERLFGAREPALPSIRDVPSLGLFDGRELFPTLGRLLPALDHAGQGEEQVGEALRLVESVRDGNHLLEYVVGKPLRFATQRRYVVRDVPIEIRLALEMTAHEDTERRALEGELKLLEREWKAAEALARIADRLAVGEEPA